MSFRSGQFEVPILAFLLGLWRFCLHYKPSVSELIYIYMSLEVLFIRQHQALAGAVASLEQRKCGAPYCLLNYAHKLGSSEQRKLQAMLVALGGSGCFVDVMC